VVVKALSRNPADRYPSAQELRADLERLARGEVPVAAEPGKSNDRTLRDSGGATMRMPPPPPRGPSRPSIGTWAARIAASFGVCLLLTGFWFLNREQTLSREVGAFTRDLRSRNDVTAADWTTYEALEKRATLGWTLDEPRRLLLDRLKDSSFRSIKDYREGYNQALSGARRQAAELALKRAHLLDPNDRQIRAMAHIVDAYGSAWTNELAARNAITTFEQAADLWRDSPDPYLGIARVAAYQLREPERVEQAIEEAVRRGYKRIERDTAMLADCRRAKAELSLRTLRKSSCEDFDQKLLERVRTLLAQAIDDYRQIPEFSGTPKSLEVSRKLLEDARGLCAPAAPVPLPQ
jgi:tetratricopeptide (TPR) repeat protein